MHQESEKIYHTHLEKMWNIENQLAEHLPKMAALATDEELKDALMKHAEETLDQRKRLEDIMEQYDLSSKANDKTAFAHMLNESEKEIPTISNVEVIDAYIIAEAQTIEHLEMSKYKTLIDWAKKLEGQLDKNLLKKSLAEEEASEANLTKIAESTLLLNANNSEAMGA